MSESIWKDIAGYPIEPAADLDFAAFESEFNVRLPEFLKQMYRIQNGGALRGVDWPEYLLPVTAAPEPWQRICSLQNWAEFGSISADDLDWIEEEYGDPSLVFPLASDGHVTYSLDYNQTDAAGEPSVIYVDFECSSDERVAPSFRAWIDQLTASESDCAVDWEEQADYPLLYRDSFDAGPLPNGKSSSIEHLLCEDDEGGLLLFVRTMSEGQVVELSRVSLPKGVDSAWFQVDPFRPAPVETYALHLQPVNMDDIHWVTSELTDDGTWKNDESSGVPVYCMVESNNRQALTELADKLQASGYVHDAPPPDYSDLPEDLQADIARTMQMGEALMAQHRAMREQSPPEIPVESPIARGDPATLSDEAIVEELSQIILYYSGQVAEVHSADDARALIERFTPRIQRYIVLLRQLGVAQDPIKGLPLRPAEQANMEAMNRLLTRSREAYELLEQNGRAALMEAMRPAVQEPGTDALVDRFVEVTAEVAELLGRIMQDRKIEPHLNALEKALRDYGACSSKVLTIASEVDAMQAGWIHQKRIQTPGYSLLRQNWNDFRTRHRTIYKKHRKLFEALEDWL